MKRHDSVISEITVFTWIISIILFIDASYFIHGSLGLFPTEEQQSKIRIITGGIAIFLIFVLLVLALNIFILKKKMITERYSKGYFSHYLDMFQCEVNKEGFIQHANLYIQIEGYDNFAKLIQEIQLIIKNKDLRHFITKEIKKKIKLQGVMELAQTTIDVYNQHN